MRGSTFTGTKSISSSSPRSSPTYKRGDLSADEAADYDKLVYFVGTFPANLFEDSDGSPLLDENGRQRTSPKL
ncbi:hypothetical protein A2U01_0076093, partial [Trifolium medium]|nr:hypothetical protein [Trifolium medium]